MHKDADIYCIDNDTEILTTKGWKKRNEINIGDKLLNFNYNTNIIEKRQSL